MSKKQCEHCHKVYEDPQSRFCEDDGYELVAYSPRTGSRKRLMLFVAGLAVLLLLAATGLVLFVRAEVQRKFSVELDVGKMVATLAEKPGRLTVPLKVRNDSPFDVKLQKMSLEATLLGVKVDLTDPDKDWDLRIPKSGEAAAEIELQSSFESMRQRLLSAWSSLTNETKLTGRVRASVFGFSWDHAVDLTAERTRVNQWLRLAEPKLVEPQEKPSSAVRPSPKKAPKTRENTLEELKERIAEPAKKVIERGKEVLGGKGV